MTAQPAEPYETIHLGGEEAAIVPIDRIRHLEAVERLAPEEVIAAAEAEEAEIAEILAEHRDWVARGRPGERDHEEFMNELLASSGGWTPPAAPRG